MGIRIETSHIPEAKLVTEEDEQVPEKGKTEPVLITEEAVSPGMRTLKYRETLEHDYDHSPGIRVDHEAKYYDTIKSNDLIIFIFNVVSSR